MDLQLLKLSDPLHTLKPFEHFVLDRIGHFILLRKIIPPHAGFSVRVGLPGKKSEYSELHKHELFRLVCIVHMYLTEKLIVTLYAIYVDSRKRDSRKREGNR